VTEVLGLRETVSSAPTIRHNSESGFTRSLTTRGGRLPNHIRQPTLVGKKFIKPAL